MRIHETIVFIFIFIRQRNQERKSIGNGMWEIKYLFEIRITQSIGLLHMAIALLLIHLERKLYLSLLKLNLIVYLSRRRAAKADELIMSGGG